MRHGLSLLLILVLASPASAVPKKALFDNTHAETAGNADWIIDTDQPLPLPDQSTVTPATPRTYWLGAISSWGIDLVKRGYSVATLTSAYGITYGNAGNPYDLSNYDVFIVPEPNTKFSAAESTAILNFVREGGGLVGIADHYVSDRNNDGWDSPMIWNAIGSQQYWGIHFGVSGDANNNIVQTSTNVNAAVSDSVTRGPYGTVTGLAFHNGTTMTLYPANNPSVRGEVWMNGLAQTSTTGLMAASAVYGNGRVVFVGDSSPADDGSAQPGNSSIYDGWGEAGATDSTLFLNATFWAMRRDPAGDTTPPAVTVTAPNGGETWKAGSTRNITWTATDAVGVIAVDIAWSSDGGATFPNAIATGIANSGSYAWPVPDAPTTTARLRVIARDAAGNAGRDSSDANFTINRWIITASAGANGTITPSGAVGVVQGASQGFSIRPATGYHVATLTVDGSTASPDTAYTFSAVSADHTIGATFAADAHTLTVSAAGTGTVTRDPDQPSYLHGSGVQLTAVPGTGWAFAGWSGDTSGTANPVTLTITGDRSVTAAFVDVAPPTVLLTAPNGGEQWLEGSAYPITWGVSDNGTVDSVNVDCSLHGASGPWIAVARGLPNSGSYSWTVPAPASDSALVRVTAFDHAGNSAADPGDSLFRIVDPNAGVEDGPTALSLARPAPNPSLGGVVLRFTLPAAGRARLEVLDLAGRRVWQAGGNLEAGPHAWRWDGTTTGGDRARAGLYFVRLATPWGERGARLIRIE
ncbi:MAG: hypothetical protein HZC42_12665 [Candidatus Eisenbacteria bacterium]|nr:hypothetical protein [Candidatus Eisenbacteria bacterium]